MTSDMDDELSAKILPTNMDAWPPVTEHVLFDPPWQGRTHVAVMANGPEFGATATYICPATPDGLPKGTMMTALLRLDLCSTEDALAAIGFDSVERVSGSVDVPVTEFPTPEGVDEPGRVVLPTETLPE